MSLPLLESSGLFDDASRLGGLKLDGDGLSLSFFAARSPEVDLVGSLGFKSLSLLELSGYLMSEGCIASVGLRESLGLFEASGLLESGECLWLSRSSGCLFLESFGLLRGSVL